MPKPSYRRKPVSRNLAFQYVVWVPILLHSGESRNDDSEAGHLPPNSEQLYSFPLR